MRGGSLHRGGDDEDSYSEGSVSITTFVDYSGNTATITFDSVPERVVVGCNTALNLFLYLGLGDRIVGVYYDEEEPWSGVQDEYDALCERIGKVGESDYHLSGNIQTDVLLSWEPDYVIGWVAWTDSKLGTPDFFKQSGVNVMSLNTMTSDKYRTISLMKTDFDNIGKIFNCTEKTTALYNDILDTYNKIAVAMDNLGVSLTYGLVDGGVTSSNTVWFYGDTDFMAGVLNDLGMTNCFSSGGRIGLDSIYEQIDENGIDFLIFIEYGSVNMDDSEADWENDQYLAACDAIKKDQYMAMKLSTDYGASPELLDALNTLYDFIASIA